MSGKWFIASAFIVLMSGSLIIAAEEGAAPAPTAHKHTVRLTKPWSDLTSLTDEQKGKIEEIHGKALEEEKAIKAKETSEIEALLTDEQKTELKAMNEKAAADRKEKSTKPKKDAGPTTAPARE